MFFLFLILRNYILDFILFLTRKPISYHMIYNIIQILNYMGSHRAVFLNLCETAAR